MPDERDAAMGFSPDQLEELTADLNREHVREREGMSYIEGWHAIAEANRIFGFDKWDRETVYLQQVDEGVSNTAKQTPYVAYIAKVRVTVRAGLTDAISREGTGYGTGYGNDKHEGATKEAETDAMKRALMTFGNPFGLALYDKKQENVSGPSRNGAPNKSSGHNLTRDIMQAAEKAYGKDKNKKLRELTESISKGRTTLVKDLTQPEAQFLLDGVMSKGEQSEALYKTE